MTTNTAFRLPVTLKQEFAQICSAKGIFMTRTITQLLEEYVQRELANPDTTKQIEKLYQRETSEASHRASKAWHITKG